MLGSSRVVLGITTIAVFLSGVSATGAQAETSWLAMGPDGSVKVRNATAAMAPAVAAQSRGQDGLVLTVNLAGLEVEPTEAAGGEFLVVSWPEASIHGQMGAPAMPVIRRLFVAPPGVEVTLEVSQGPAAVIDLAAAGLPTEVMPVQPPIPKIPGARENAVFQLDRAAYAADAAAPAERVTVTELGIVRGQRLFMLEVRPVAYNPARGELTCWSQLSAAVGFVGSVGQASHLTALPGLDRVVLNPDLIPQAADRGTGHYVIVVADDYESYIGSFASAKAAQGFTVTTHVDTSGNATTIKNYIQGLYDGPTPPDYVLLVGDTDTIPHWTGGGEGSPATDLPYSCMDGSSDWYPDLPLGRFSVRSSGQVQAIVDKTLYYEDGPLSDPNYVNRAVFMASEDNYPVSEGTHNWVISNYMDPNGIVSDKLYCHTYGATTQQVRDAFNDGRFFGIYSGHGGTYSWADGPPFSQSDVNNLTNADMYPFVCSFACITGTYTVNECFTETWIRAADKGALAIYGSSVNSYWTQDDVLERRLFDVIYDEGDDVPSEVGPVWNETRMRYLDQMGSGSTTRRYFEMYNLLGDPSLPFPNASVTGLKVSPMSSLESTGPQGGPFTPDSIVYTLENLGPGSIDYNVSKSQSWVSITNGSGTLPNPSDTAEVTVSLNAGADSLPNGYHTDTVNFVNTTDHVGDTTRGVMLTIGDNDNCAGAFEACPGTYTGDTNAATNDGSASCGSSSTTPDVWYSYTPGSNGTATFSLCDGTSYDSVLSVHSGCPGTTANELGCDDDYCGGGGPSQVTISVTADNTYLIRITGWSGSTGSYMLTLTGPDCAPSETCDDGVQNQGEDRIDCGGPCPPCECTSDGECDDGTYCDGAETCDAYGDCQEGTPVDCPDDGAFCNGDEFCDEGADTCGHTGDPCTPPEVCDEQADMCVLESTTIESAASCQDHGGQEYCMDLAMGRSATVEPRQGGVTKLMLQTADPVEAGSTTADATCVNNVYGGTITVTADGTTTVQVDPDPFPDQDCCTIVFAGGIEDSIDVQLLAGDVDGDVNVSTADGSSITQRLGLALDGSSFWYDVDLDGSISTADGSFVTQRLGNVAPLCP